MCQFERIELSTERNPFGEWLIGLFRECCDLTTDCWLVKGICKELVLPSLHSLSTFIILDYHPHCRDDQTRRDVLKSVFATHAIAHHACEGVRPPCTRLKYVGLEGICLGVYLSLKELE